MNVPEGAIYTSAHVFVTRYTRWRGLGRLT